jgi:hypothetical protein
MERCDGFFDDPVESAATLESNGTTQDQAVPAAYEYDGRAPKRVNSL